MPGPLPLALTLQLSVLPGPQPLPTAILPASPVPVAVAGALLTDLVISAGEGASPYRTTPRPSDAGWTCHGVDNATLAVAARCPLVDLRSRVPREAWR